MKKKYDLLWIVGGQVKEVVLRNQDKALVIWKKRQLETSTHKMGKLVPYETGSHKH